MLPPQAHSGLSAVRRHSVSLPLRPASASITNTLRASPTTLSQSRSFWNWRRSADYTSHIDPLYHRFTRFRTLKTRAKLIEKLKRRGKFDWDVNQRPFFTPRHIRLYASINGKDPRWSRYGVDHKAEDPKKQTLEGREGEQGEDGYELSQREKEWKEKMEYMRKRIETDPYEAVFGKRFEPFWSPLVPSWMREEMGLQGWPKAQPKELSKAAQSHVKQHDTSGAKTKAKAVIDQMKYDLSETIERFNSGSKKDSAKKVELINGPCEEIPKAKAEPIKSVKPSSYSSYTSTSWDSWTNKERRTEWDSVSGETKRFEYDPVSNRMVQIEGPKAAESTEHGSHNAPVESKAQSSSTAVAKRSDDMRSLINTPDALPKDRKALDIPIKKSDLAVAEELKALQPDSISLRKLAGLSGTMVEEPLHEAVTLNKSIRSHGTSIPASSTPPSTNFNSAKPAALSKLPENDVDLLTADDVRAKMGKIKPSSKSKPTTTEEKAAMEANFEERSSALDSELDTILKDRELTKLKKQRDAESKPTAVAEWDKAEQAEMFVRELDVLKRKRAKLLDDEHGLFHIERQKRELGKLDQKIKDVERRLGEWSQVKSPVLVESIYGWNETKQKNAIVEDRFLGLMDTLRSEVGGHRPAETRLQTALDRANASVEKAADSTPQALQSAVDRMQSQELPKVKDLDDSAAHESTETSVDSSATSNVPKNWSEAADVLQASRVKRTAAKRPYPMTRWIDDMNARKAAHEASKAPSLAEEAAAKEKAEKLQKANDVLEAEVKEQKFRMQAHENRYAHKIRSLRGELDTAYKQSAVHSEKHVERIRFLEAELAKASKAAGGDSGSSQPGKAPKASKADPLKEIQGEGDFCPNITKYAGSAKWYKQPALSATLNRDESEKAAQKARDQSLVKEVREIYEREYGVIDRNHRQRVVSESEARVSSDKGPKTQLLKPKQVVEVESDVDLGDALAEHEKTQQGYGFKDDGLEKDLKMKEKQTHEAEIAAQEKEAHEAQALMQPESAHKMERVIAEGLKSDMRSSTKLSDLVNGIKDRRSASSTKAALAPSKVEKSKHDHGVPWEEPPVYRVLAYDSGNDMLTTATTTANFTGSETPISIPQALSQLYQPARFVPHFAELQQDGWQVVHGTRDLLVFRKVKAAETKTPAPVESVAPVADVGLEDHGLHTLVRPMENAMAQEAAEYYGKHPPKPKAYDPTSIENGKLMPYENAMAQEAANAYDKARKAARTDINPIDGTTKTMSVPEVSTGNFASPTGFVNHDPVFPDIKDAMPEELDKLTKESEKAAAQAREDAEVEYKHYPRVRRQEPHFSGQRMRKLNSRQERHQRRWEESRRERRRGGALKWALTVGVGAAGLTYVVGVAAEMARQERHEKERWQEILEGKRSRWE